MNERSAPEILDHAEDDVAQCLFLLQTQVSAPIILLFGLRDLLVPVGVGYRSFGSQLWKGSYQPR